jgi:TetR/AcrR family transcriptional repressor of nem operon
MPSVPEQKEETRRRIIDSARRLFNRRGFIDVTIEQIMAEAGMTHGGFYKHFSAKEDLYAIAVRQFGVSPMQEPWQHRHIDPTARDRNLAAMIVNAYLSRDHLDDRDGSCPMIGLPSDVARGSDVVKRAFSEIMDMMVGIFAANLEGDDATRRERALALASTCVGGMVLARAVDSPELAHELREAARRQVFGSAGWPLPGSK